ncbi:MAG: S9 family peptidase [Acidobacteria bacterium]|nr:S9 family peptidase [Acidobacteriota bacterium]
MRSLRLCATVALLVLPSLAAKSPITHEAVWLMKRVGAPVPSPNGKWVAFSLVEPSYDDNAQVSDLWIVPADGSAKPRRLTATKGAESGAAWSPDSRRLAFSAKREGDEANQIYVIDVEGGGEALRATSLSTGAAAPAWRPDGKAIAFTSNVYPGAVDDAANRKSAEERKNRKYRARVYEGFPIRYWDHWLDDTRPHLFVQELGDGAKAKDLLAGTKMAAEPGFAGSETMSGAELNYAWSPDGQSLVFAATTRKNEAAYASVNMRLYRVPAGGGEPEQLTNGNDSYDKPVFRPDGKALYCFYEPQNGKVYNLTRIAMFGWPVLSERTIVTAAFDRSVSAFDITPDSGTIYLLAEDAGHEKLYAVAAAGGPVRPVFEMESGVYTNLAIPAKAPAPFLFAGWESAVNPAEVVRIDPAAGRHSLLTDFSVERAAAIDWQPLRHFWFTSKRGTRIHSMIALPPNFDASKKYPLFVLIHGGPHNMWRDQFLTRWNYHLLAEPGYVVLLTNYTGSTGFGEKFAQGIQLDPLAGPGAEINEAADEAIRRFPFIDGARQAAGGASYGGHLANWLQATTTRYRCLISHAGLINLESQWGTSDTIYHREVNSGGPVWEQGKVWREQNPIRYAANFRTPILLSVGERDFRVPLNQTLENWSVLQRLRIPSRLIVFEQENHWISKGEDSRFFYGEVQAWLRKHL